MCLLASLNYMILEFLYPSKTYIEKIIHTTTTGYDKNGCWNTNTKGKPVLERGFPWPSKFLRNYFANSHLNRKKNENIKMVFIFRNNKIKIKLKWNLHNIYRMTVKKDEFIFDKMFRQARKQKKYRYRNSLRAFNFKTTATKVKWLITLMASDYRSDQIRQDWERFC